MNGQGVCIIKLSTPEKKLIEQALVLKMFQLQADIQALGPEFADLQHDLEEDLKLLKSLQTRLQYAINY